MTIRTLLVANRGEIAVRVFRTCARLGIETVAVVAPDDRGALHARRADRTIEIARTSTRPSTSGLPSRQEPTRSIRGTDSWPRTPRSPRRSIAAGVTWVGPSPEALRLGGDKIAATADRGRARRADAAAGLTRGDRVPARRSRRPRVAAGAGCASSRSPAELGEALAAARREAKGAFGDDTVFCERYLERPRHVEAQLLGHRRGVTVLGGRDCSIQRRHQKLIEESPPPGLDPGAWARIAAGGDRLRRGDRVRERGHRRVPRLRGPTSTSSS